MYFENSLLSDALTHVIVPAVNKNNNEMMLFNSWNALYSNNDDYLAKHVARATSAAPTFFSAAEFSNITANKKFSLIDGGIGFLN